jgi:hypothetical protein
VLVDFAGVPFFERFDRALREEGGAARPAGVAPSKRRCGHGVCASM